MTDEQKLLALEILAWASLMESRMGYDVLSVQETYIQWRRDPQEWRFNALLNDARIRGFPGL